MGAAPDDIEVIENTYHTSDLTAIIHFQYTSVVAKLEDLIAAGGNAWVACTSKAQADALADHLRDRFPDMRMLCVTRDNSQSDEVRDLLDAEGCPGFAAFQVVIASPAISTGVSVDIKHFDQIFGFGRAGSVTATEFVQMLRRVRTVRQKTIHLHLGLASSGTLTEDASELSADEEKVAHELHLQVDLDYAVSPSARAYIHVWAMRKALRNRSHNFFRFHTMELLAGEGITVQQATEIISSQRLEETNTKFKSARQRVRDEHIERILAAEDVPPDLALSLKDQPNLTPMDRAIVERAWITKFYGRTPDRILVEEHVEHRLQGRLANFRDLYDLAGTEAFDRGEIANGIPEPHRQYRSLAQRLTVEILEVSGIGLDFQGAVDRVAWRTWLEAHHSRLPRVLRVQVGERLARNQELQVLGTVLRRVGQQFQNPRQDKATGLRTYRIDLDRLGFMTNLLASHCAAKFTESAEWVVHSPVVTANLIPFRSQITLAVTGPHGISA